MINFKDVIKKADLEFRYNKYLKFKEATKKNIKTDYAGTSSEEQTNAIIESIIENSQNEIKIYDISLGSICYNSDIVINNLTDFILRRGKLEIILTNINSDDKKTNFYKFIKENSSENIELKSLGLSPIEGIKLLYEENTSEFIVSDLKNYGLFSARKPDNGLHYVFNDSEGAKGLIKIFDEKYESAKKIF